jgi:HEAT repeat protein
MTSVRATTTSLFFFCAIFGGGVLFSAKPALGQQAEAAMQGLQSGSSAERLTAAEQIVNDPQVAESILSDLSGNRQHLTVLRDALSDPEPRVRRNVVGALYAAGLSSVENGRALGEILPALSELLISDDNPETRELASYTISLIKPRPPEEAVPSLREALGDSVPDVRRGALIALGAAGSSARSAVPDMLDLLNSSEQTAVKKQALLTLGNIHTGAAEVEQAVLSILREAIQRGSSDSVKEGAVRALAMIGPAAEEALPGLRRLANQGGANQRLQQTAEAAVQKINSDS